MHVSGWLRTYHEFNDRCSSSSTLMDVLVLYTYVTRLAWISYCWPVEYRPRLSFFDNVCILQSVTIRGCTSITRREASHANKHRTISPRSVPHIYAHWSKRLINQIYCKQSGLVDLDRCGSSLDPYGEGTNESRCRPTDVAWERTRRESSFYSRRLDVDQLMLLRIHEILQSTHERGRVIGREAEWYIELRRERKREREREREIKRKSWCSWIF